MNATITRRHFLAIAGTTLAAGALVACNSNTDEVVAPGTDPAGAAQLRYLRVSSDGGFVPRSYALTALPTMLISEGRAFEQGAVPAIYPGPALTPLWVRSLDAAALEALASAAATAGLLAADPGYGFPNVADVPTTNIELTVAGTTYTHSIAALGMEDDQLTAEHKAARAKVAEFLALAGNLDQLAGGGHAGEATPYVPESWRLYAEVVNPADYAADVEPQILPWPITSIVLANSAECTPVSGPEAAQVATTFAEATQLTFFTEADLTYQVLVRPVLPGEPAC